MLPVGGAEQQKVVQATRIVVDQLQPFTNYTFYVMSYNKKSPSLHSEYVQATTAEDGKTPYRLYISYLEPPVALPISYLKGPCSIVHLLPRTPCSIAHLLPRSPKVLPISYLDPLKYCPSLTSIP